MALVGGESLVPVARVGGEVHLLGCPEGGHRLLVELPDLREPDREHGEAVRRLRQQRLLRVARGHQRRRGRHRRSNRWVDWGLEDWRRALELGDFGVWNGWDGGRRRGNL
uniref:Ribonucleoside-diphosphate reductase small chain n=1 Tax=Arundo donax TaxID=35708 RepID=A0A0A9CG43_ARUDO